MKRFTTLCAVTISTLFAGTCSFAELPKDTSPSAPSTVSQIKIQPDKAPDCSSLKTIAESVTRDCKDNDAKAIAIYNFMQLSHYHLAYPTEPGKLAVLKEINCYGWSLCGGLHSEQSALWRELGWGWRFVGWDGHTTVEAEYDGRWHYLDVFLKFYAWTPDGKGGVTIASEDDLTANPDALIKNAFSMDKGRGVVYMNANPLAKVGDSVNWQAPAFLVCGDTIEGVISGLKTHKSPISSSDWAGIKHDTGSYSTDVNLAPGFALANTWDPITNAFYWSGKSRVPRHSCSTHKDTRNDPGIGLVLEPYINSKPARSYGNGLLSFTPDFSSAAVLKSFIASENVKVSGKTIIPAVAGQPASVTLKLSSPYILTIASGEANGASSVEVSVDSGKTFKAVDIKDFSTAINGQSSALVKIGITEALSSLKIEAIIQNNPGALPYLSPGKNKITVSVADPKALADNKLVVTYAYRLGSRSSSFDDLFARGKELAKQQGTKWSDTITYVQKSFNAKDLPATFDIDCPTPKGQFPVYPRMMFVRREIVGPGSSPLPLPPGAVAAQPASTDELQTLPNPFLVGTQKPDPSKISTGTTPRTVTPPPAKTQDSTPAAPSANAANQFPLTYVQCISDNGESKGRGNLFWPKGENPKGASVILLSGNLKNLPPKGITAARMMVPILQGYDKSQGKLGVVFPSTPLETGKPFETSSLTDVRGTCVIEQHPPSMPRNNPPKMVTLDVTQDIKAIASGAAKFNGLVLRMVPDRSIDDGYSARCEVSATDNVWLEIDVAP